MRHWTAAALAAVMCLALAAASEAPAAAAPAEGIAIRDYTQRGFAPDVVSYTLDLPASKAKRLRVLGPDGAPRPVQIDAGPDEKSSTLSFVTELPPGGSLAFKLSEKGDAAPGSVKAKKNDGAMELTGSRGGVRVPAPMEKRFDKPVAAKTLPAPILAFRSGPAGAWIGAGRVLSERPVKAMRVKLLAEGPVTATIQYELEWAKGGFYRATVSVSHDVPLAKVREEFDAGEQSEADFWELDLGAGWSPDAYEVAQPWGNGVGADTGTIETLDKLAARASRLQHPTRWCLGFFKQAEQKAKPDDFPIAGYIPMNRGWWRRLIAVEVASSKPGEARLRFPMAVRQQVWYRDVGSDTSPYSTHEHDPGLPPTLGRRAWGLLLGTPRWPDAEKVQITWSARWHGLRPLSILGPTARAWSSYGIVGLDRYKDFVLEWPDSGVRYPRLYRTAPAPAQPAEKIAALQEKTLRWVATYMLSCPDPSHHVMADNYLNADAADEALSWPELPADKRAQIRAQVALALYLLEDADVMQYANGGHPGNPNMGTARFMSAPAFLALLPDHPAAPAWRRHVGEYTDYKLASQIAPGGGYVEYGGAYHMHGYARATNGLPGLVKSKADKPLLDRVLNYHKQDWDYYLNLLTPEDPRWGSRIIPGMANSPPSNTATFQEAAASLEAYDKPFAANLLWGHQANGASTNDQNPALKPLALAPAAPRLTSRIYPGVGVVFRAHQGPDETFMLLRSGFNWSHWYIDPGHMILQSRGAVILPDQPYQYHNSPDKSLDLYNTVRFGDPANQLPYGWPDGNVLDHQFGPTIDYAWASTGFPDWYIDPGITPPFRPTDGKPVRTLPADPAQTPGGFAWDRQVMFLKGATGKSPNYFVIRDSTSGPGALSAHLFLNLLGGKENIQSSAGRLSVDTPWPTRFDLTFLQPSAKPAELFEEKHPLHLHGVNFAARWPKDRPLSPHWVGADGKPVAAPDKMAGAAERHVIVRLTHAPGAGQTWVIFPRGRDEPEPRIESPSEGVVKITHAEGTDYVFLASKPFSAQIDDVAFEGDAGAVRVGKSKVTLAVSRGLGSAGYKGHIVANNAQAFEIDVPLGALRQGRNVAAAPPPLTLTGVEVKDWSDAAPGVRVGSAGDAKVYAFASPTETRWSKDGVSIEGGAGYIVAAPGSVRFVVGDARYARLSVGAVGVRGVGPFDLTFTDSGISGKVMGRMRSIATTWPQRITRPMFTLDGVRYFAGFADDPTFAKGLPTPQLAIAFGVFDGVHDVAIREWTFPTPPATPQRARVKY